MSDNRAAFRVADGRRFVVREADDQFADDAEIIVRNAAISMNPVDSSAAYPKYPQTPGVDAAGEVIDVGVNVENIREGDRAAGNVGSNAVQLARAAGHTVIGAASPANTDLVKKLGAHEVVNDRGDRSVVIENVKKALKGKECVGAFDAAGFPDGIDANGKSKDDGTHRLAMDIAGAVPVDHIAVSVQGYEDIAKEGVVLKDVMAAEIRNNENGKKVYTFLYDALRLKQYQISETTVVGNKLEDIWEAVTSDKRVKGKKIILLE